MALVVKDRIKESSSTTGQGTLTLGGAETGFRTFADIGDGNTTYYAIVDGNNFEVGIGTYTASGTTLSRDTVLQTSAGNTTKISCSGAQKVFITQPADKAVFTDASGDITLTGDLEATQVHVGAKNASFDLYNNGTSYFNGAVTVDDTLAVNSGTTNTVATFTSTDSVAEIQMTDSSGTAGISAEGDVFQVRPAGGASVLDVSSTTASFGGKIIASSSGIEFNDATTQTTAYTGAWSGSTNASNSTNTYTLENDFTGGGVGHTLTFKTDQTSQYSQIGKIDFFAQDSGGNSTEYGAIDCDIRNSTDGSETSQLGFNILAGSSLGYLNHAFSLDGDALVAQVYALDLKVTDGKLTATTSSTTGGTDTANVAEFKKKSQNTGLNIVVYSDGDGHSQGIISNMNENTTGGLTLQDSTYDGLGYFQDTRTGNHNHVFSSYDGSTYRTLLTLDGDSNMNATFGGKLIASSSGIQFNDGTTQTTAATGGMTAGKSIVLGLAFG